MRRAKLGLQMVNASSAIFRIHRSSRFFSAKHMLQVLKIPVVRIEERGRGSSLLLLHPWKCWVKTASAHRDMEKKIGAKEINIVVASYQLDLGTLHGPTRS